MSEAHKVRPRRNAAPQDRRQLPEYRQHHLHGPAMVQGGDAGAARAPVRKGLPVRGSPQQNRRDRIDGQGAKQLDQPAYGARARALMDWSGMEVARAPLKDPQVEQERVEPWKKAGFDHRHVLHANAHHFKCNENWPCDDNALAGAVIEWNGMPVGRVRLERKARPAYGRKWELCVGDPVDCGAFVRAVPRLHGPQFAHRAVAPWEKDNAVDARVNGMNQRLLVEDPGRRKGRAMKEHDVMHHPRTPRPSSAPQYALCDVCLNPEP